MKIKCLFLVLSVFCLSGCFDIKGDDVAFIYPKEGIANIRQFTNSCPVQVTKPRTVAISELSGWVCINGETAAKYRREYEKDNNCN